jgi:hypothetical protein
MPEKNLMLRIGRREFSRSAVIALLSSATITIADCGGGSEPTPTPRDVAGSISANHGHTAVVTAVQITAADAVALDILGSATHHHRVDLSAAEVVMIGNRQTVSKVSSNTEGHGHTVTFN